MMEDMVAVRFRRGIRHRLLVDTDFFSSFEQSRSVSTKSQALKLDNDSEIMNFKWTKMALTEMAVCVFP